MKSAGNAEKPQRPDEDAGFGASCANALPALKPAASAAPVFFRNRLRVAMILGKVNLSRDAISAWTPYLMQQFYSFGARHSLRDAEL